ncbi:NUDIX hydrolase [Paenibacillus macquariensis]|uniref:8-oxo-dGTP diphosphatase n=1 Tax=Paenibacillus macquariensis TaxID=948756 RepID=A0ABY1JMC0_9BACL|nr:NUDIX domain-containing protein [Paenibacillus macquariensis]MEC0092336.1 NUDIX domain-containing protein [Paenibacillus macquariensis]OAB37125.1 DNA mismatch repair protein MutT [Paenibacillus macquariensis subsp. macquariensis]SIQ45903.1 8-oxo-dGTP diphosphatase [Paenibacillus macquariensis]
MDNKIVVVVKGVIENKGKILILKRSDIDEIDAGVWETVGGKIDFGEELEDALTREVKEETGIVVNIEKLLYATTFFTNPNRKVVLMTYLCRTTDDQIILSDEHSDYLWVTRSELYNYLPQTIINDLNKHNVLETIELIN